LIFSGETEVWRAGDFASVGVVGGHGDGEGGGGFGVNDVLGSDLEEELMDLQVLDRGFYRIFLP